MRVPLLLTAFAACFVSFAVNAADPKITTVLSGLDNPTSVVQSPNGDWFVADSGAGKVIRVVDGKAEDVIVGFPLDVYGKGPKLNIGPLGLAFINDKKLVVGDGSYPDGQEFVRIFDVPAKGAPAVKFDAPAEKLGPLEATDTLKAEGNFYGIVANESGIYVTSNGDDTKGWILKSAIDGTKFGKLERYIATKEAVNVDAPVAITLDKKGNLVVGQMGEVTGPADSRLCFYGAKTGKLLMNLETGLADISGLAYSPKGGLLYATDYAWAEPAKGGLFRLDKGDMTSVKVTKICELDKPTAITFGKDGAAYVTVIGTAKEGDAAKPGKLLKIEITEE